MLPIGHQQGGECPSGVPGLDSEVSWMVTGEESGPAGRSRWI